MQHRLSNINEIDQTATCKVCGENTPIRWVHGRRWGCVNKARSGQRETYSKAKESGKAWTDRRGQDKSNRITWSHGLTVKEAKALRTEHSCAICGEADPSKLCVDHDHNTGEIRGVLCRKHNLGIGQFNDSIEELEKAIAYLKNPPLL